MTRHEKMLQVAIDAYEKAKNTVLEVLLVQIAEIAKARGITRIEVIADSGTYHRGSRTVACRPAVALIDAYCKDVHATKFFTAWTAERGWA